MGTVKKRYSIKLTNLKKLAEYLNKKETKNKKNV